MNSQSSDSFCARVTKLTVQTLSQDKSIFISLRSTFIEINSFKIKLDNFYFFFAPLFFWAVFTEKLSIVSNGKKFFNRFLKLTFCLLDFSFYSTCLPSNFSLIFSINLDKNFCQYCARERKKIVLNFLRVTNQKRTFLSLYQFSINFPSL